MKTAPDEIFFASDRSAALEASGILLEGMPRVYTVQILAVMVAILNHSTKLKSNQKLIWRVSAKKAGMGSDAVTNRTNEFSRNCIDYREFLEGATSSRSRQLVRRDHGDHARRSTLRSR